MDIRFASTLAHPSLNQTQGCLFLQPCLLFTGLMYPTQRHQPSLKIGGCGSGFKTWGSWILNAQQTEAR